MITADTIHPQFVTDKNGICTSVLLPFTEYQELLEDLEDLAAIAENRTEETLDHNDVIAELKRNGLL